MRKPLVLLATLLVLASLGLFVAALSARTEVPVDGVVATGQFSVSFALAIALIVGRGAGGAVEDAWQGDGSYEGQLLSTGRAFARLLLGVVLFFIIMGATFVLEALGIGGR